MNRKINLTSLLATVIAIVLCFAPTSDAQTYETASTNTGGNPRLWMGNVDWDSPFGTPTTVVPGSALNGTAALDDAVVLGRYLPFTNQFGAQIYRTDAAVGETSHLQLGSANQTLTPVFTGGTATRRNSQVQLQVRHAMTINGDMNGEAVLYGGKDAQGGIVLDNGSSDLIINGDLNFLATNQDGSSWPVTNTATGTIVVPHFIRLNNGRLELNGDINGADAISLQLDRGDFVMPAGPQTFDVNALNVMGNINPGGNITQTFTFPADKTINAWTSEIGKRTNANAGAVDGTLDLDGAMMTTRSMFIGVVAGNASVVVPPGTANGTVDVANGSVLNVGRVNLNGTTYGGGLTVGDSNGNQANAGTGTLNINSGGTVNSWGVLNIGGGEVNGNDDGSTGTVNVNTGGVLNVGQVSDNNKNLEVGRDGTGFLNVNGGVVDIGRGNLVIGQSSQGGVPNDSRGTVVFDMGATVTVGNAATDGMGMQLANNDLNFNRGGGDVTHTGAGTSVTVENNLNFQETFVSTDPAVSTNPNSSYTIDNGTLDVGADINARGNLAGSNTLKIVGDLSTVMVANNINLAENSFNLEFDFLGGSTITDLDVGNNANISGMTGTSLLTLSNTSALASYTGDILLVDVAATTNGQFSNAPQGTVYGAYMLTYVYDDAAGVDGGGQSIALVAVPEPTALALIGLAAFGLIGYARRRR